MRASSLTSLASVVLAFAALACGGPDPAAGNRTPVAEKWLTRARASYRNGDIEDATAAIDGALKAAPKDPETHLMAGRIALAKLDFDEAARQTEGIATTDARGIRGRAFWYAGDIERAADELEEMLRDPAVKDSWARDVAKLARRGQGRHPFAMEGAVVVAVEMPQAGPALIVPCELEGERILALVATNYGELMIDSASRKDPAWVNLRFDKMEVKDVPALTHDLSGVSRQLGAPIKALIGVNVLRRMHVTFDRRGSQFVVRKSDPSPPPEATKLPVFYARGGAMMMRGQVSSKGDAPALLFVDSSAFYPLALDDSLLKRSGADLASFHTEQGAPPNWKVGMLPYFKLGNVDLPQVPAMQGANVAEYKQTFDVDLNGIIGAGLLSVFRVTFGDEGRAVWLEIDPSLAAGEPPPARNQAPIDSRPDTEAPKLTPPKGQAPPKAEPPKTGPMPNSKTEAPKTESKGAAK